MLNKLSKSSIANLLLFVSGFSLGTLTTSILFLKKLNKVKKANDNKVKYEYISHDKHNVYFLVYKEGTIVKEIVKKGMFDDFYHHHLDNVDYGTHNYAVKRDYTNLEYVPKDKLSKSLIKKAIDTDIDALRVWSERNEVDGDWDVELCRYAVNRYGSDVFSYNIIDYYRITRKL